MVLNVADRQRKEVERQKENQRNDNGKKGRHNTKRGIGWYKELKNNTYLEIGI